MADGARTRLARRLHRAFFLMPPTINRPRVRNQSDRMQMKKATAETKKACKRRPSRKRLKGFEPSTFCMASRTCVSRSAPLVGALLIALKALVH
jgi:hypothetical protein